MSKHTPGPWKIVTRRNRRGSQLMPVVSGPYMLGKTECGTAPICSMSSNRAGSGGEQEANARLIAAAPELLKCCVSILNDCADWLADEAAEELRAVIAKAEGTRG